MIRYFLVIIGFLALAACTTYHGVTQTHAGSFLQLSGDFQNTELSIDEQTPILIDKSVKIFKVDGKRVAKFAISEGTHTVKISKNGQIIVSRKVFVSEGNAFEVIVP